MDRRTRFFWTLSIFLAIVVLLWQGIKLNSIRSKRIQLVDQAKRVVIGTDQELEKVITSLENSLKERSEFVFDLRNNPMKLDKVVFMTDDMGRLIASMQANTIRVSGLYMNFSPPKATAEFQGKEYTLTVGSKVGEEKVIGINKDGIVTLREGKRKFHPLQGRTLDPSSNEYLSRRTQYDEETY